MAKAKKPSESKKQDRTKPSMRDLANSSKSSSAKKRSLKKRTSFATKPFRKLHAANQKRRKFKLPDNRFGKLMDRTLLVFPRYLKASWGEIRQTTWPNRKETIRLTFAVFIFSTIFAIFVATLDFALDKIFKNLITK